MSQEWTRMEEGIVRQYWGKVPERELVGMLSQRNAGSIAKRARLLGLNGSTNGSVATPQTEKVDEIAELEALLVLKRAEAELEKAEGDLDLFEGEMLRAFKLTEMNVEAFVKLNQDARGKKVASVSNARRKLLVAKLKQHTP